MSKFLCKKCRLFLFDEGDLLIHDKDAHIEFKGTECRVFNVNEPKWMEDELRNGKTSGKIYCLNKKYGKSCMAKLGEYTLYGSTCSCGKFVAPAFLIPYSKVDIYSSNDQKPTEENLKSNNSN